MKKTIYTSLLVLFALPLYAQMNIWYVQLGVFENKVALNYFSGLDEQIYYSHDSFGFHRYLAGTFSSESEAQNVKDEALEKGFNCIVISESKIHGSCCNPIPYPHPLLRSIKNIFFDFDKSFLRKASKKQLNDLATILNEFPGYTTVLRAHTDAKGSLSYNEALSMRRAESAQRYLLAKGISAARVSVATFGENEPIAKNELDNGRDTEEGRQFNRRVEILIYDKDGSVMNGMVDEIEVPEPLVKLR